MVLWGKIESSVQEQYQDTAIRLLIPMLSSPAALLKTEALLSTAVVLRMVEQLSEISEDGQYHLKGAYSLLFTNISVNKWHPFHPTTNSQHQRHTIFWTYLRLCLRVCFLSEQECVLDLSLLEGEGADRTIFAPAPDEMWTNRMSYLLTQLCNACWAGAAQDDDDGGATKLSKLKELSHVIDRWRECLPSSFKPWFFQQDDLDPFPVVRYLCPWHGM